MSTACQTLLQTPDPQLGRSGESTADGGGTGSAPPQRDLTVVGWSPDPPTV